MKIVVSLVVAFVSLAVPTTRSALAQSCTEYFTAVWGNTLDMSSSEDILNNFPPAERNQLSTYSFTNGIFSTSTTGGDGWFRILTRAVVGAMPDNATRYGDSRPVDSTYYKQLTIRMFTDKPSNLQVFWDKPNGNIGSSALVPTSAGWQTYVVNLNVSSWAAGGVVHGLRVDPSQVSAASIMVDYLHVTPTGCNDPELRVAPLRQPDQEGGEDYFTAVKGNPANFDSITDIEAIGGHSSSVIYPSNSYQDSGGFTHRQDYLEATNTSGDGDAYIHLLYPGIGPRIDASRYKIACWTFDILRPADVFHSMVRFLWRVNGENFATDDFVTAYTGERRYCTRLDTVQLEPSLASGATHPWRNNSDGTGLDFFRFDPHEETVPTSYRLADVRLAAFHEADKQYAIVVGGDRTFQVEFLYKRDGGALTSIGVLPANRNTDVFLWNTEGLQAGTYEVYSKVGLTTLRADGLVVIEHAARAQDSTVPVVSIDVPSNQHVFGNSLQIAGWAEDNRRIAAIEATLDGQLIDSFSAGNFDQRARDLYPQFPYTSEAGFNRFIDTTGIAVGSHALVVTVYDTAGNTAAYSATVNKQAGAAPDPFDPPFTEGAGANVPQGVNPGNNPGAGGPLRPLFTASLRGTTLSFSATARGACPGLRLLGGVSKAALKGNPIVLSSTSNGALKGQSAKLQRVKLRRGARGGTRLYFTADCGAGTSAATARAIDVSRLKSSRSVSALAKVLSKVRTAFRAVP
jgi:Bacterial Ig domain